jgi:flagellar biosynthetic protein FliQ
MNQTQIVDFFQHMIWMMLLLSTPVLVTSMVVGIAISIFQAVTQIQEQTITFVPKILAALAVFVLTANWSIDMMLDYTREIFDVMIMLATQQT